MGLGGGTWRASGQQPAAGPGGRGAQTGLEPGPPRVCAPPRRQSPPTSSAPAVRVQEPGSSAGSGRGAPTVARSPATIATLAAASRAMNLPRGLLVAWTLSLWPGTFPPSPPFASGSSLVLQDLCSSCEEKDETRLPWHYLGTQVCRNPLQLNCTAKIAKEGVVPRKVFLGLWCVWDKKKLLELLEQLSTLGAPPPRCSCGNKFPRVHRATRASLHCQGPRPQLGKGTDRAERV